MSQITTISLAQRPMLPQQLPRRTRFVYPKGGTEALPFKEDLFHFDAVDIDRRQPTQVRIELRNFISFILFQCGTWTYKSNYAGIHGEHRLNSRLHLKCPARKSEGGRERIAFRETPGPAAKWPELPLKQLNCQQIPLKQFHCQSRLARTHAKRVSSRSLSHFDCSFISAVNRCSYKHSIQDRHTAFWKNSATKAKDEALEHSKALKQVAQEATEVKKSFTEVLKRGAPTTYVPKSSKQAPPKPKVKAAKTPKKIPPSRPVVLVYAKIEALEDSGLAITPANKESAETLTEALTKSEALQGKIVVKSPVKKNPRIVVYDLDKSDCRSREKEKKFLSLLAKDNHLPEGKLQVRFRLKGRGSKEHWVIVVDPIIRKVLGDQRRILAGFSTYRFKDYCCN
ncbi:hypothetical protein CDAR_189301, partial [Caerostris darwini]